MKTTSLLFGLFLLACSGTSSTAPAPTTATTSRAPVIAALQTHDGKITILGGGNGDLHVNLTQEDGTVIADHPDAWAIVKSSVAQNGAFLDATYTETPAPTLK